MTGWNVERVRSMALHLRNNDLPFVGVGDASVTPDEWGSMQILSSLQSSILTPENVKATC